MRPGYFKIVTTYNVYLKATLNAHANQLLVLRHLIFPSITTVTRSTSATTIRKPTPPREVPDQFGQEEGNYIFHKIRFELLTTLYLLSIFFNIHFFSFAFGFILHRFWVQALLCTAVVQYRPQPRCRNHLYQLDLDKPKKRAIMIRRMMKEVGNDVCV